MVSAYTSFERVHTLDLPMTGHMENKAMHILLYHDFVFAVNFKSLQQQATFFTLSSYIAMLL